MAKGAKKGAKKGGAKKAAAPAAAAAPAEVQKQPSQNGVTRPKTGTATGRIWEIADAISAKDKKPAGRAEVLKAAEAENINASTAATQYGRWRKFHNLGRYAAPVAASEETEVEEVEEEIEEEEEEEEEE